VIALPAEWPGFVRWWAEALLRASWQGGVAILAAYAIGALFPRMPAAARCWLWRLAYLKLLIGFLAFAPIHLHLLPANLTPVPTGSFYAQGGASRPFPQPTAVAPKPEIPAPPPARPHVAVSGFLVFGLWLVGALCAAGLVAREWLRARRLYRACRDAEDGWLQERLAELAFLLGVRKLPRILLAEGRGSPLLVGSGGAAVLLPASVLKDYSREELELMLAHELAHLKRGDLLWSWLPAIAHWLFFFHPLVWLANREWRMAQEMACDELAMEATSAEPGEYGQVLVRVAAQSRLNLQSGLATVGLEESPETLKRRLNAMQHPSPVAPTRAAALSLPIALVVGVGLLPWRLAGAADAAVASLDAPLRYGWQAGRTYSYAVTLEAETEEYQERYTGHLSYLAQAVEGSFALSESGSLFPMRTPRSTPSGGPFGPGAFPRFNGFGGPAEPALIRLDPTGRILEQRGESALPHSLGSTARMVVEPLPEQQSGIWRVQGDREIVLDLEDDSSPGAAPPPFRSPWGAPRVSRLAGTERAFYAVEKANADSVEIKKQYELQTVERVDGQPRLDLRGEARLRWDVKLGVPRSMEFHGTLTETATHVTRRTPLMLRYVLQDAPPAAGPAAGTQASPAPAATRKDTADLLADLGDKDTYKRQEAANRLSQQPPLTAERAKVVAVLKATLADEGQFTRLFAVRALKAWGSFEDGEALVPLLKDEAPAVRWAAIEAVAALKEPSGLSELARMVEEDRDRLFAAKGLKDAGPAAEEPCATLLNSRKEDARAEACRILETVGGPKSLPALTAATKDDSPAVRAAAEQAVQAIRKRNQK
jgi:beta-lactamase regulating signal transducer with metallopeptidase domain